MPQRKRGLINYRPIGKESQSAAPPEGYLWVKDWAKKHKVTVETARRWIDVGELEGIRVGDRWAIRADAEREPPPKAVAPEGTMSIKECAEETGKDIKTLRKYCKTGKIASVMVDDPTGRVPGGKLYYIYKEEVERLKASRL